MQFARLLIRLSIGNRVRREIKREQRDRFVALKSVFTVTFSAESQFRAEDTMKFPDSYRLRRDCSSSRVRSLRTRDGTIAADADGHDDRARIQLPRPPTGARMRAARDFIRRPRRLRERDFVRATCRRAVSRENIGERESRLAVSGLRDRIPE